MCLHIFSFKWTHYFCWHWNSQMTPYCLNPSLVLNLCTDVVLQSIITLTANFSIHCNRTWTQNLFSLYTNIQRYSQTDQKFELCGEFLSVRSIRLYVIVMSSTYFRADLHSIVACMSRNSLLKTGTVSEGWWLQRDFNPQPLSF